MPDPRARLFNTLASALLALTALMVIAFVAILVVSPPPPSVASVTDTPTPTDTPSVTPTLSKTPRPTNTSTHTPTPSDTPTATPVITQTVRGSPTVTPTPGPTLTPSPTLSAFNYIARVEYQRSIYGLNWAGIAGLVFGLDRKHQTNILVRAWGDPPLGPEGQQTASGLAVQYGVSGFEFTLGSAPVSGNWNVQLIGDDGAQLSDIIAVEMSSDPRFNLVYIIFEQNH